jgi:hypothetical protein
MLVAANHADNSIFLLRASDGVSSCLHRASLERAEATCGSVVAGHGVIPTLLTFCRRNVARDGRVGETSKTLYLTGCDGFGVLADGEVARLVREAGKKRPLHELRSI